MKGGNAMRLRYILTLPLGMLLLAVAILMVKFVPANNFTDFVEGLLLGMSVVLNLYCIIGIIHHSRKRD